MYLTVMSHATFMIILSFFVVAIIAMQPDRKYKQTVWRIQDTERGVTDDAEAEADADVNEAS